ncbi:DNA-binding GntR family transcriptional regulator [Murinocardiopsis flavida]|uniref:DNA-binding GntR family transcriptional regulator n=1 Tax=Murinocardiopsis flavida TaxID=645275 RepID=A0A2P8CLV1_9ACTN|nr:GntR family transcriptional regulator [Murinocardiopsis flavida]PSK85942.1 DNA-binding GntR family transcriptional regulator [Murinocardiopsis flavida]
MRADVYDRLREDIVTGRLETGAPLTELALADRYGVSRTPIREALRRLLQDGLVERFERGMRVRGRSPEEILEIYGVRVVLEGCAARAAAENRSELDLVRIRRAATAMTETDVSDPYAMAAANRAFHEMVWAAAHNNTLLDLLSRLNDHLARYPATTLTSAGRWESAQREHEELVAAIEERRADDAASAAERHMTAARDIRLRMYAEDVH